MRVFIIRLPDKPLTNFELSAYDRGLGIPLFSGVFMTRFIAETKTTQCRVLYRQPEYVNLAVIGYATIGTRAIDYTLTHLDK